MTYVRIGSTLLPTKTLRDVSPALESCDTLFKLGEGSDGILNVSLSNNGKDLIITHDEQWMAANGGKYAWKKDYGWGSNIAVQCCEKRAVPYSKKTQDGNLEVTVTALPVSEPAAGYVGSGWGASNNQAGSQIPHEMSSATCGSTGSSRMFVAWTAHKRFQPDVMNHVQYDRVSGGHVSEFTVAANGTATKISDVKFDFCESMGAITASADCGVVGVLCRSDLTVQQLQQASGWKVFPYSTGEFESTSQLNQSEPWVWKLYKVYLLEWTGGGLGVTSKPPTDVVHVQSNAERTRSLSLAYNEKEGVRPRFSRNAAIQRRVQALPRIFFWLGWFLSHGQMCCTCGSR